MGLLMDLIALPVTGPIKGVMWIAQKLVEQAEKELYDSGAIRAQLMELELRYDLGEISEEEYLTAEEELLVRLRPVHEHETAA